MKERRSRLCNRLYHKKTLRPRKRWNEHVKSEEAQVPILSGDDDEDDAQEQEEEVHL
jgi:hypothetical protein